LKYFNFIRKTIRHYPAIGIFILSTLVAVSVFALNYTGGSEDGYSKSYTADAVWDGGGTDNKWSTANNWNIDIVPTGTFQVQFDDNSSKDVTIDTDVTTAGILVALGYSGIITQASGNSLTVNGAYSQQGGTFVGGDSNIDINGAFTVSGATFTSTSGTMGVSDDFTLTGTTSFTNSGTLIFDGDLTYTDSTSPQQDVGFVVIGSSPDTTELASDMTASSLTITTPNTYNTNGYDLDISGTLTINGTFNALDDVETDETVIQVGRAFIINSTGNFSADQSTIIMDGTVGTFDLITDGDFSLYNLTINNGGTGLTVEVEDALDVNGTLTITSGTLDVVTSENNGVLVGGNLSVSPTGSFIAQSGTLTMDGTGTQTISGTFRFFNFKKVVSSTGALVFEADTLTTISGTMRLEGAGPTQ